MSDISLVHHFTGAPGLRLFGLGPNFRPCRGLIQIKKLFDDYAFWSNNRSIKSLKRMLANSSAIVTVWEKNSLIGFGRATSDKTYRAVLWDIIVKPNQQGIGLGKEIVNSLIHDSSMRNVERIYLMTTNSSEFYKQIGFKSMISQELLIKDDNL